MKTCLIAIILWFAAVPVRAQDPKAIPLWPNGAPGSEGKTGDETVRINPGGDHIVSGIRQPSIIPYLPDRATATGAAVVIAPGGSHRELWIDHEGYNVAKWLSAHGIAGIILKYRLAREQGSTYTIDGTELADMQRAIRLVRKNSSEWGINPDRIGVIGFSAGGEVAALAGTRYHGPQDSAADPIDRLSDRPAFQALIYAALPADMPLSKDTPPAFIACGANDGDWATQGATNLFGAMKKAGVSVELHLYAGEGHGFGLRTGNRAPVAGWIDRFREWLDGRGFLKR